MEKKKDLLYRNAIVTCWIMLIVCVILKIFGVPWFDIDTNTEIAMKISRFASDWNVYITVCYILFLINTLLLLFCINVKLSAKSVISSIIYGLITVTITIRFGMIFDFLFLLIVSLIENKRPRTVANCFIAIMVSLFYQLISLYIRNVAVCFEYYVLTEGLLLNVDYYIMLLLTSLYLKKGGNDLCSIFHSLLGDTVVDRLCSSFLRKKLCEKHTKKSKQHSTVNREEV